LSKRVKRGNQGSPRTPLLLSFLTKLGIKEGVKGETMGFPLIKLISKT